MKKNDLINNSDEKLLGEIANLEQIKKGAFNIGKNGQGIERQVTENVNIITKQDKPGIDIYVKENICLFYFLRSGFNALRTGAEERRLHRNLGRRRRESQAKASVFLPL